MAGPSRRPIWLDTFKTGADVEKKLKVWEMVADNLRSGDMPPQGRKKPTEAELNLINSWLDTAVFKINCELREPGRVTIRRLNRAEYNNTIRDLVGVNFRPADDFPSDDVGYGFDNIGDVLSMPPILMEKYLAAAERILDEAIVPEVIVKSSRQMFRPQNLVVRPFGAKGRDDKKITFTTTGNAQMGKFHFAAEGDYIIRIRASGEPAGNDPPRMSLSINDKELKTFDVKPKETKIYEFKVKQTEGERKVSVAFLNPFKEEKAKEAPKTEKAKDDNAKDGDAKNDKAKDEKPVPPPEPAERKLIIEFIEVEGPISALPKPLPEPTRRILIAKPTGSSDKEAAAAKIIENFARKAYRRPVQSDEVQRLLKLFKMGSEAGESFDKAIKYPLQAVLVSPHFLFRIESDGNIKETGGVQLINEFELATRLSYFLWSSMPDAELFELADKGKLRNPGILESQITRMLKDAKAKALTENFANQWLTLRNLKEIKPDTNRFPSFNDQLRDDMLQETALFFQNVMTEDRSILEFLDADYTFLNARLAKLYGIGGVNGPDFRKVKLTEEQHQQRGGLLMQASVLTVTSNPTRTSPVKRGKFILDNILGTPPPPPPPDVPELKEDGGELKGTLRQRMEQHRSNPSCIRAISGSIRLDSVLRISTPSAPGAPRTAKSQLIPPATCPAANRSAARPSCERSFLNGRKHL